MHMNVESVDMGQDLGFGSFFGVHLNSVLTKYPVVRMSTGYTVSPKKLLSGDGQFRHWVVVCSSRIYEIWTHLVPHCFAKTLVCGAISSFLNLLSARSCIFSHILTKNINKLFLQSIHPTESFLVLQNNSSVATGSLLSFTCLKN